MLRTNFVLAAATCVLVAGCAKELSSKGDNGIEHGALPVKFASLREVRSPQARLGATNREILSIVGGDRGSGPEIAVDLEWVLRRDRRERLGVPVQIVSACRSSLVDAGRAHGIIWVDAASAGRVRVSRNGAVAAPIEARLTYERAGSVRTKQSLLICHLSPQGTVIALR